VIGICVDVVVYGYTALLKSLKALSISFELLYYHLFTKRYGIVRVKYFFMQLGVAKREVYVVVGDI
jgi:hypothetical protein